MGGRLLLLACIAAATLTAMPRPAEPCSPGGPVGPPHSLPEDGTTGVPTNSRVVVEWQGGTGALSPGQSEVVIRVLGGSDVDITATEFYGAYRLGVELTPLAPLLANTEYEVLARPTPAKCGFDPLCPDIDLEIVATFTTGSAPDVDAPTFAGLEGVTAYFEACVDPECTCDFDYERIIADMVWSPASDTRPEEWIRYNVYQVGFDTPIEPLVLGAALIRVCSGDDSEQPRVAGFHGEDGDYYVRAVDLAGNEDDNTVTRNITIDCATSPALPDAGLAQSDAGANAEAPSEGCCSVVNENPTSSTALALLVLTLLGRRTVRRRPR